MEKPSAFHRVKRGLCPLLLALAVIPGLDTAHAAFYAPGDVVTNLTFIARRQFTRPDGTVVPAGSPARLQDFAGRIVFLEWFAVWCPYCTAAVPQIDADIVDWYAVRGGNPQGVPVLYLFVNQESASFYQTPTDNYINANLHRSEIVLDDYGHGNPVRFAFQSGGQPIFVAINGVTNSPTHQPWQVLINHLGYGDTDFSQEVANFRSAIDAVQPPVPAPLIANAQRIGADFQFTFLAAAGRAYRVQGTTNLVSWNTLSTVNGSNAPVLFRHTNAAPTRQLYRVVTP